MLILVHNGGFVSLDEEMPCMGLGPRCPPKSFLTMTSGFGLEQHTHLAAYSNNAMDFLYATIQQRLGLGTNADLDLVQVLFRWYLGGTHEDDLDLRGQITGYGGGGLRMSARDLARLGVLYLGRGMGRNTLSRQRAFDQKYGENAAWAQVPADTPVTHTLANQTNWNIVELSTALPYNNSGHTGRKDGFLGYSYGMWVIENGVAFAMSGKKGNYVIVDWSAGLVIVILNHHDAHPPANRYLSVFRKAIRTRMETVK